MLDTWFGAVTFYHVCLITITTYVLYITWLRSKYPPGPWPLPIIGNLHLLSQKLHFDLTNLAKQYGPVYTLWMGPRPTVVVCDLNYGKEVTVTKGNEFAGRAMDTKCMTIISHGQEDLVSRSLDEKVSVMRKIALSVIKSKGADGVPIAKIVEDEAKRLITQLKELGGHSLYPRDLTNIAVSNTILELLFNYRFRGVHDPEYEKYVDASKKEMKALQKCFIADVYFILWYIMPSVRKAAYEFVDSGRRQFVLKCVTKHEETYQEDTIRDFTDVVIKARKELEKNAASSVIITQLNCELLLANVQGAAVETTIDLIMWSFAAVLHQPSLQEKIFREMADSTASGMEIDDDQTHSFQSPYSHLGIRPFIDISFKPKLPYLNAFIHEMMRMCPTAPLGVPHKTMIATSIGPFPVPKDTRVLLNIFSMNRDGKVWEDPSTFKPERFLTEEGDFDSRKAKNLMTFSKGPRNCIGENVARIELFTFLANIFYNFVLSTPDIDKVPHLGDGVCAFVLEIKPFDVTFTPRG